MKKFLSLHMLKKKYYTMTDLFAFLEEHSYPHTFRTIQRWEERGIIPVAKTVKFRGFPWRVYNKDGSDFRKILEALDSNKKMRRIYVVR